jgi:hypothetical protein
MEPSEAIEAVVRKKAAKLDSFASDIMSCRVVVEPAGRHRLHGNSYEVHLNITLPCGEIAITRRNCVLGEGFERLQIGAEVAFAEEEGVKGPHATIVKPVWHAPPSLMCDRLLTGS